MIAVDTNILVYAHRADSPFNAKAQSLLRGLAGGMAQWAVPWPCFHEFLNVVTHPRVHRTPTPLEVALEAVGVWLATPNLTVLSETGGHWPTLRTVLSASRVVGPAVHDARVAAICLQHGISEFWSADRDFGRFPQLRVVNPLVGR